MKSVVIIGSGFSGTLTAVNLAGLSFAVPELRSQAFRIAEKLAGQLAENLAKTRTIAVAAENVIEYSI